MNLFVLIMVYLSLYLGLFTLTLFLLSFLGKEKKKFKDIGHPQVSILIPAYNEQAALEKTVESAAMLDYPKSRFEIIIIDDGSTDKTSKISKELIKKYENVKYYWKENGGKGSALNFGIKKSKGDFIVTLDADSFVNNDALKLMMPHFSNPKVMAVTNAMKVYEPKTFFQRIQAIEYDLGIFFRKSFSNMQGINVTPGPFSIIRKTFFKKYGGYDEHNLTEDMEMAMRIQSYNYLIENEPKAIVYTVAPRNFLSLLKQRRRWYVGTINIWKTYRKLFGKSFGEFGLFVLPLAVISVIATLFVTVYYVSRGLVDSFRHFMLYSKIGYDFFNNMNFQIYYVIDNIYNSLSEGVLFFAVFFMIFTIILLIVLNKKIGSGENAIRTFINYLLFMVTYGILYSFWWVVATLYSISGRRVKW